MKQKKFLQGLISFLTAALMFFAFGCAAGKESGGENLSGSDSLRESQSSEVDKTRRSPIFLSTAWTQTATFTIW